LPNYPIVIRRNGIQRKDKNEEITFIDGCRRRVVCWHRISFGAEE
jgi:hypothetical protein